MKGREPDRGGGVTSVIGGRMTDTQRTRDLVTSHVQV